jgi:glyoxylase-like metal-dependent hydrolase (beta-lactamase superfamily II)
MTLKPIARMTTKIIGDIRVDALVDWLGPTRRPEDIMRDIPTDLVENNRDWLIPDYLDAASGQLILAYQSFLIQTPKASILVDCAIGEDGNYPLRPDWHLSKTNWLNHLGKAGFAPDEIDIVFLTHLHMDHTGWLTRKHRGTWVPTFPNARHLVTQTELDFWSTAQAERPFMASSIADCVDIVRSAGLLECVLSEAEIDDGLFVVDLSGHSPGMIGLEYRDGDRVHASFCADLMHHPLQLTAPQITTIFCEDSIQAVKTRHTRLEKYADDMTVVFNAHFPGECAGTVIRRGHGFHFRPLE